MKFNISNEKAVHLGFLKVLKATISHDSFTSDRQITAQRECLERGDSVAVLIYESDTDSFLFTRQFRYPSARRDQPWMLELVAGSIDKNEGAEDSVRREVLEEVGYELQTLEKIVTYFPSPGGSSEQIHLFYSEVESTNQKQTGGGKASEKEDIQIVKIKKSEVKKMLRDRAFNNSITIIGLQWYFLG